MRDTLKMIPEGLEEAAFTYENDLWESGFKDSGYSPQEVNDAFKAGAEWGAEQKAIELFRKQNCKNCGSQRCTGEGEWLEGCEKFREWKDKT